MTSTTNIESLNSVSTNTDTVLINKDHQICWHLSKPFQSIQNQTLRFVTLVCLLFYFIVKLHPFLNIIV